MRVLLRCLALTAVVAGLVLGLVGMHVLTGAHTSASTSGHAVPMAPSDGWAAAEDHDDDHGAVTAASATEAPEDDEDAATAACALFLTAAGIAVLVALHRLGLRPAHLVEPALPTAWVPSPRHRGPPPWAWPRFALCVVRT